MNDSDAKGPGVPFPPPLIFAGGLALAWFLETQARRFPLAPLGESGALEAAGLILIAAGVVIMLWAMHALFRARTPIIPIRAASSLVESGPYRISRNPMYTGLALSYLGLMMLLNWGWALVIFPLVIGALHRLVISREEGHLQAVFGAGYDAYCRRVRRWI